MTDDRSAFEGIQSATILRPGDRVLLIVEQWDMEQLDRARLALAERFPEVEFTYVSGVEDVVVKPAEVSTP